MPAYCGTSLRKRSPPTRCRRRSIGGQRGRPLAAAWAEVLGISADQIGRQDHFFELGGTSLSALRLAIALDRAVSFKDVAAHPILADQAALIDDRSVLRLRAAPEQLPSS